MNNDSFTTTSQRGRQRVYASSSEKLEAFRERHKDAGYLRKEVLVHESTAQRLADIAKAEGASVTNTASGLLELGIAQYEALKAQGLVARYVAQPSMLCSSAEAVASTQALPAASEAMFAARAASVSSVSSRSLRSVGSVASPAGALSSQDSSPLLGALDSSYLVPTSVVANPIASFFEKRKNSLK